MLAVAINAPCLLAISAKPGEDDWFMRAIVLEMHVLHAAPHIKELARSPHLARLTSLSLRDNRIGDLHVMALAASPHLSGLTAPDLGRNAIGGGGVRALATTPNLPTLTKLDLSHNDIDDSDMRTLAGSRCLAYLAYLDASSNLIVCPEDVGDLLSSPRLPRLAVLDLRGTCYNDEWRRSLQDQFGGRVRF